MSASRMNIAVLAGYWSTNIGNSFFQLGAQWLLQQARPDANVFLIGDQPGYYMTRHGNPRHALDYVAHLEIDALAVLGPFGRPEAPRIVADMLHALHRKGTKILVLAAGMMRYDDRTVQVTREILSKAPPFLFTSRDTETYERLGDLAEHAYDGIDVATFVADLFEPVPTDLPPYVVLNFDQIPEPTFVPGRHPTVGRTFEIDGQWWTARQPRWRTELSYKHRAFPFLEAYLPVPRHPEKLGEYLIIRTDHRYNPFLPRRSYRWPNSYAGDIPHSYLNLYANAAYTLSNRVHGCVASVCFGTPALLFTRSPRAYLLKRLKLEGIKEGLTGIDMEFLRREKRALIDWVTERMKSL
jgi:hypothetical protein